MDGLLIDSEPLWMLSMQEVFETVGAQITPELAARTTGLRTVEVVAYWHEYFQWTGKSCEQVTNEILESIIHRVITEGRIMEGVPYILDYFQRKGLKMGLASSSPMCMIEAVLKHFGLYSSFQGVYSAEFETHGKPHPAVYLSCARELGSNPIRCLAFEDSINGMVAAKAARMKVVVVPESHNQANPRYALADLQLQSLSQFSEEHFDTLVLAR